MARFFGAVGFASTTQNPPGSGVWEEVITEKPYFGDVIKDTRKMSDGQSVNTDITVQNSIEIVADGYANENISAIRFVEWAGAVWTVTNVEVRRPRLLLRLGEVWNGSRQAAPAE